MLDQGFRVSLDPTGKTNGLSDPASWLGTIFDLSATRACRLVATWYLNDRNPKCYSHWRMPDVKKAWRMLVFPQLMLYDQKDTRADDARDFHLFTLVEESTSERTKMAPGQ
jgi:hypothetical protein